MSMPAGFAAASPMLPGWAAELAGRWRLWRQKRRWIGEMKGAVALDGVEGVLHDIGITRAELDLVVDSPADAGTQFQQMAEMSGIDLQRIEAAALREAVLKCTSCERREPCKRWLRSGVWRDGVDMRCPNAALFHD